MPLHSPYLVGILTHYVLNEETMNLSRHVPGNFKSQFREQEDRARDLGLVRKDAPFAHDDDYESWIIPNPMIIEETERGTQRYDLYSRLLKDRIIFLGRDIDDRVANLVTAQLLFLEMADPEKDVNFYLNSPGGIITSGMAMYDTMELIRCDVATVCIGQAASMGAVLLLAGAKGKRAALPHARIMIHQPLGGAEGQVSDLQIQYREMMRVRNDLYTIMANHTEKNIEEVEKACNRDNFMSPEQAKEFGIIDLVVENRTAFTKEKS
jgi:ATP-dependent Clp protease, protease subunit